MARKKTKKIGIAGKYGPRYGRKTRKNVKKIESETKSRHKCPRCGKLSLKRTSTGVWECSKCGAKFAGGAYVPQTGLGKISGRAIQAASKEAATPTSSKEVTTQPIEEAAPKTAPPEVQEKPKAEEEN